MVSFSEATGIMTDFLARGIEFYQKKKQEELPKMNTAKKRVEEACESFEKAMKHALAGNFVPAQRLCQRVLDETKSVNVHAAIEIRELLEPFDFVKLAIASKKVA